MAAGPDRAFPKGTALRRAWAALAGFVLLIGAGVALAAGPSVHVGVNDDKEAEIAKTIRITKPGNLKPKSVVALASEDLGPIQAGDTVRGLAEVEVSVTCTEPSSQCIGKIYKFSPKVVGQLIIGDSKKDRRGQQVGRTKSVTCAQDYPNRNHHCVLVFDREAVARSNCGSCTLNVVMTASHRKAKRGNVLVIGADANDGVKQGKASISAAVFRTDPANLSPRRLVSTDVRKRSVPVVDKNQSSKETVIASLRMDRLEKGEEVVVEARARTDIRGLGYNVLTQGELLISEGPLSTENKGVPVLAVTKNGKVSVQTGFNCTQGKSAFDNPCLTYKVGAFEMLKPGRTKPNNDKGPYVPLYVNLVAGASAQFGGNHRSGDKVRVRSVQIKALRYTNAD